MHRFILALALSFLAAPMAHAACPAGAIVVRPGSSIQAAVNAAPVGSKFCIGAGQHREQSVVPTAGMQFYGEPGADMIGSRVLTGWTVEGARWFTSGPAGTPPTTNIQECAAGFPQCNVALAVYFDTVPLLRATSKANINSGSFWRDASNGRIYIGKNPTGHIVEVTTTEHAFSGNASNILIKDLGVLRYGARLQRAAIYSANGTGWVVDGARVIGSYGVGVDVGSKATIRNSTISGQGEMGIGCGGTGNVIADNKITDNGYWAGLDPAWEGGGLKCTEVYGTFTISAGQTNGTGLTISGNTITGNRSVGAWIDEGRDSAAPNDGIVIRNNTISGNDSAGISVEISRGPVKVIDNVLANNGVKSGWFWGGCLQAYDSENVEAYGNTCDVTAGYGAGMMVISQGGREVNACRNNFHNNRIILRGPNSVTGATGNNLSAFCSANGNRFDHNTYYVATAAELTRARWAWQDDEMSWAAFRSTSRQEANGTTTAGIPGTLPPIIPPVCVPMVCP